MGALRDAPDTPLSPAQAALTPVDRLRAIAYVPRIVRLAVRLVRTAAPRLVLLCLALQVVSSIVAGAQILVINHLVSGLLELAQAAHPRVESIAPELAALAATTLVSG